MHLKQGTAFEPLESRTLMSASLFSAAVTADRGHIHADLLKLNADFFGNYLALLTDTKTLKADHLVQNTTLEPLVAQLRSDIHTGQLTLRADRLNEAANVVADEQVVVKELQQMQKDKHNTTALAADKTQLSADRVQLQSDMVTGLTQRIDDRETIVNAITTDGQAVIEALPTSGASEKLATDVQSWLDHKYGAFLKISADLTRLSNDRSQLITDLSAQAAAG